MPGLALTLLDRFPHLIPLFPRTDSLGAIRPMLAFQLGLGSGDSRRAMEYKPRRSCSRETFDLFVAFQVDIRRVSRLGILVKVTVFGSYESAIISGRQKGYDFRLSITAVRSSCCCVPLQCRATDERNRAIISSAA